jgi:hypothetical protein
MSTGGRPVSVRGLLTRIESCKQEMELRPKKVAEEVKTWATIIGQEESHQIVIGNSVSASGPGCRN